MALTRRAFLARGAVLPMAWGVHPALLRGEPDQAGFPGMIVRSTEPRNWEFPFSALQSSITPNEHFYIRNHFPMPAIELNSWKLSVEGAVKQKLEFTYADLLKLPTRSLTATLECAGNGRVFLTPPANGTQWSQGAVGNAVWSGVPLAAILEKAGLKDEAVEVVLEGFDRGQVNSEPKSPGPIAFARSLPIDKAKHSSVLLAYKMNDADLPQAHGMPLRAVVGGWYGMASVKWLSRIIVVDKPFKGFWQTLDYAYWKRQGTLPTLTPITNIEVKSSIARPAILENVPGGKIFRVFGAAWAGESAVAKVEISTDAGKTWEVATLLDKPMALTWTLWEYNWNVPRQPGKMQIISRAIDADGKTQPKDRDVDRRNYMISHITPTEVLVQ